MEENDKVIQVTSEISSGSPPGKIRKILDYGDGNAKNREILHYDDDYIPSNVSDGTIAKGNVVQEEAEQNEVTTKSEATSDITSDKKASGKNSNYSPLIYENGRPDFIAQGDVKNFSTNQDNIPSGINKSEEVVLPVFKSNTSKVDCTNNKPIYEELIDRPQKEDAIKAIVQAINCKRQQMDNETDEKKAQTYKSDLEYLIRLGIFVNVGYRALYYYNNQLGIFKSLEGNAGIAVVKSFLKNEITAVQGRKLIDDLITDSRICISEETFYGANYFVNLGNGVLDLGSMMLNSCSAYSKLYFRVYLGANFIEGYTSYEHAIQGLLSSMPYTSRFIATSLENSSERVRLMFEIIGYCISNITPFKKLLICQGANDSGKSLIMKLLLRLLTEYSDNNVVATLSLAELGRKFSNQLIDGAKLVCSGEIDSDSKSIDLSMIKKITGGDSFTVEKKFCNPRRITPHCKLLFNTNEPLDLTGETTYAMVKRIHTLKFPISIPESQQDPNLLDHILTERNQIVTIAMWALKELVERGEFTKDPDYLELEEQYIAQIPEIVIDKFISEKLIIGLNYYVTEAELQDKYSLYCYVNDYVCLKANTFLKRIKTKLNLTFEIINNQKVIKGIAIKGGTTI